MYVNIKTICKKDINYSEADIEPAHAQPTITCNVGSRSQLKQYDTEVVTKETVVNILTALGE